MADEDQDQKTEQASEKKLNEAHERGQFAKSPELSLLVLLAATLGAVSLTIANSAREIADYAIAVFTHFPATEITRDTITIQLGEVLLTTGKAVVPILLASAGAAILTAGLQSGFRLTPEALSFSLDRLDPAAGFARIFSKNSLIRTGIDCLKMTVIGSVLYAGARALMADPLFTVPVEAAYLGQFLSHAAIDVFLGRMVLALSVGRHQLRLREVQDLARAHDDQAGGEGRAQEQRRQRLHQGRHAPHGPPPDAEADAFGRGHRRRRRSPTRPTTPCAQVRARQGQGAGRPRQGREPLCHAPQGDRAEHGVPIVENKPVARVLFGMGKVGETIPTELYQAVAEILAVVYRTHRYYFHRLKSRRMEASA
jgi:flagellar biosynthetic protein FlhB